MLVSIIFGQSQKVLEVKYTDVAPKIDGYIEEIWQNSDSVGDFVQFFPYEKNPPSETTVIHLLQDKNNLYVAFRCYNHINNPTIYPGGYEDYVVLYLDPMSSKTNAYFFQTTISGLIQDGMMVDNGLSTDESWDGVWFRGVKTYDDRYEVEFKIPFKSIRYKSGLTEWGINFARFIARANETDYWTEVLLKEKFLVSKFGALKGINPQATGYYFELYPEGYVRYDEAGQEKNIKPSISLNFKWDVSTQTTFNATVLPDFAQIESDPYTLNLSRYPVYLSERRPFFIEGSDIFKMPSLGQFGLYSLMNIFYSRRIGKAIGNDAVPILGGLKVTTKSEKFNLGMFGAYTGEYLDTNNIVIEPSRMFGAFRAKHQVFNSSDIGMLFSGTMANKDDYNYAFDLDGVFRAESKQFIIQAAMSDKNRKRDWALSSGYSYLYKTFLFTAHGEFVRDSFDVSDIGFMPWAGRKRFEMFNSYWGSYPKGFVRDWSIGPGILLVQEPGDRNWSKILYLHTWPSFRSGQELIFHLAAGPYYEADTNYIQRYFLFETWRDGAKAWAGIYCKYTYCYNYAREFLAYQGTNELWGGYRILPNVSLEFESDMWIEWDTVGSIAGITPVFIPEIGYSINKDMKLRIFDEIVTSVPKQNFKEMVLSSNRIGLLLSWNFLPKSWFYFAINDNRERIDNRLRSQYFIGVIKAKYLLYF
jgi:hypothetical protein